MIHLSRINKLTLLRELFSKVVIPTAVYREVAIPGEVGYKEIKKGIQEGWLTVKDIRNRTSVQELAPLLHKGEAEAIILTEESDADYLIVDERVARHIAASRGIRILGILGILGLSVQLNIINTRAALRLSEALIETGYTIDVEVYEEWRGSLAQR